MHAGVDESPFVTHEVLNQPPPLQDYDLFRPDATLVDAVLREGGGWGEERLCALGQRLGQAETLRLGDLAHRYPPVLRTHDRFGHRIDEVEFHPAWHDMMRLAVAERVHALPWAEPRPGVHVVRAASAYLVNQVESGVCCPMAMTFASLPALADAPALMETWAPKILSSDYDPRLQAVAFKRGALVGMAMTEKQGGSDVRANTTRGEPTGDGGWRLVGHKWFCSAAMSDAFLTLAQTGKGLSCFFLPRIRPDGSRNAFRIQRLKDKLGNRSNASAEVEYAGAFAWLVGEEGEGVRTIIKMVHHTRLDSAISSAGLMRRALAEALHHAAHRTAFERKLIDQPLMQNLLADLELESEAALVLLMRLARAFDEGASDARAQSFARIATAIAKYWVCKQAPQMIAEALEVQGGNGYVEDSVLARLYREAPVNSIWEGSGNVICLDVLRALARTPDAVDAVLEEIDLARGAERRLDVWAGRLKEDLARPQDAEMGARRLVECLALALQAALLIRHAPAAVADAFCASRLDRDGYRQFGTLPPGLPLHEICERAQPKL
jgi:putative acyl-CoA dehydrogenase